MKTTGVSYPLFGLLLGAPWCATSRSGKVIHAATFHEIAVSQGAKRSTVAAPCGAARLKLLSSPDEQGRPHPWPWPPRVANLADGVTRCRDCHEMTGRKRPDPSVWPR